jgi:hypothetical protein
MTYTHLTIDELTTIYSFWKLNKKAYRVAPALTGVLKPFIASIVFLTLAVRLLITNNIIDGTNNIVGVSPFNYPLMNWFISKPKFKRGGNQIQLLIATNVLLAAAYEPYIAFSNVMLLACSPKIYPCMVSVTLMGTLSDEEKLGNWAEI